MAAEEQRPRELQHRRVRTTPAVLPSAKRIPFLHMQRKPTAQPAHSADAGVCRSTCQLSIATGLLRRAHSGG